MDRPATPSPTKQGSPRRDRTGTWFADERGIDRRMKITWHPERKLLVLSLWHEDTCTATFRLGVAEVPRLVGTMVEALGNAARGAPDATTPLAGARERLARWRSDRRR